MLAKRHNVDAVLKEDDHGFYIEIVPKDEAAAEALRDMGWSWAAMNFELHEFFTPDGEPECFQIKIERTAMENEDTDVPQCIS